MNASESPCTVVRNEVGNPACSRVGYIAAETRRFKDTSSICIPNLPPPMLTLAASLALGYQLSTCTPQIINTRATVHCSSATEFDKLVQSSNVPEAVTLLKENPTIELSAAQSAALLNAACASEEVPPCVNRIRTPLTY